MEYFEIPKTCPVCGGRTEVVCKVASEVLVCTNPECSGSLLNRLVHFCCKKGLDIKGLSEATLEKLLDWGWVNEPADLYSLADWATEWIKKPGFGVKSVQNTLAAIEASRTPKLESFICALGIPHIGRTLSHELAQHFKTYDEFRAAVVKQYDFTHIEGIAYEKASAIWNFDYAEADEVAKCMRGFEVQEASPSSNLEGESICITGRLVHFRNRDDLVKAIQDCGGKVVSGVSKNTTWLINNDIHSNSVKNATAEHLGIPIITEEEFINLYLSV